jgi:hypothetical protein
MLSAVGAIAWMGSRPAVAQQHIAWVRACVAALGGETSGERYGLCMARVDGVAGCGAVSSYVTVLTGVPRLFDASHVRVAHPGTAQRLKFQGESTRATCAHGLLLLPMDVNRRAAEICLQWATG